MITTRVTKKRGRNVIPPEKEVKWLMFAERLDAVMKIADVSNSQIGRQLNISGAHIGRLRSGVRSLPKDRAFLTPMCNYLVQRITKDYQRTALRDLTGMNSETLASAQSMVLFLEAWLQERDHGETATGRFVSSFSYIAAGAVPAVPEENAPADNALKDKAVYYYGNSGKRRAVERFFQMILQEQEPQTLILFSDEPIDWLYENAGFVRRWFTLFVAVLQRGNSVKIIHTVSRNMNEMMEGITKWLPIYMAGTIEPYYYPRLRDGVFRRTLFVASKTAAVSATSVQQNTERSVNLFVTDKSAVKAFADELEQYLAICKPLMRIFKNPAAEGYFRELEGIGLEFGDSIMSTAMPLIFSMPEKLAKEIAEDNAAPAFLELWRRSLQSFRRSVKKQRITEVILAKEVALLRTDALELPMSDMVLQGGFRYTEEQYLSHLENLYKLQKHYQNFTVIEKTELPLNILFYCKEEVSAVVAKTSAPSTAFVFSEQNMVAALNDYLKKNIE